MDASNLMKARSYKHICFSPVPWDPAAKAPKYELGRQTLPD